MKKVGICSSLLMWDISSSSESEEDQDDDEQILEIFQFVTEKLANGPAIGEQCLNVKRKQLKMRTLSLKEKRKRHRERTRSCRNNKRKISQASFEEPTQNFESNEEIPEVVTGHTKEPEIEDKGEGSNKIMKLSGENSHIIDGQICVNGEIDELEDQTEYEEIDGRTDDCDENMYNNSDNEMIEISQASEIINDTLEY